MNLQVTDTFNRTSLVYYPNEYRQIVSMGGSRSSKSYSILQILMLEMINRPMLKITAWRDTKVTCRGTILDDFKKIIMFDEKIFVKFKENIQKGTFTYKPNGARILFEGADSIGKVLGGTQDISFFNEVTEFSKSVYLQITQRTADRIFCDYNPHKDFWLERYREDEDTAFIHSTFKDNAFCPPNIVKQLLSYEPWETGSYVIIESILYYKGQPISLSNQPPKHEKNWKKGTADPFMWLVYGLGIGSEKPNRIHRGWHQISQDRFDSLDATSYFGLDFGQAMPTAIIEVKYDGDGAFYICPRFYKAVGDLKNSLPTIFKLKIPQIIKGQSIIVGDSAKQAYIDDLRMSGQLCVPAIKGPGSILSGISNVQNATIYFVSDSNLNKEYNNYSWQLDRYEKPTDIPIKVDDHYMDALRYVINYLIKYLSIEL